MHDLERQIIEWRKTIAKASHQKHEGLDELEAHLREEIDRLLHAGTPKEDVFQAAVSNLGLPSVLAAEFDKLIISRRVKWKPITIAHWICMVGSLVLGLWLVPRIMTGNIGLLLASHVGAVTIGYTMTFILGGLGICYVLAEWFGKTGPTARAAYREATCKFATVAAVLTACGVILAMFWAKEHMGRYWAWDPKECGGLLVLGSAIATMAVCWLQPNAPSTIAFTCVMGNICTAWAWFGANTGFRAGPLLIAFTISQCIVLAAIPLMHRRNGFAVTRQ
jgi:hypothetical protein